MEAAEASGDPAGSSCLLLPGPHLRRLAPHITPVAVEVKIQPRVKKNKTVQLSRIFLSWLLSNMKHNFVFKYLSVLHCNTFSLLLLFFKLFQA